MFDVHTAELYVLQLGGDQAVCFDPSALFPSSDRSQLLPTLQGDTLANLVKREHGLSAQLYRVMSRQQQELNHYMRGHSSKDEGYKEVCAFAKKHKAQTARLAANLRLLKAAEERLASPTASTYVAKLRSMYLFNGQSKIDAQCSINLDNVVLLHETDSLGCCNLALALKHHIAPDDSKALCTTDSLGNVLRFDESTVTFPAQGERFGADGSYYRGSFTAQLLREGNGFAVDTTLVKCGAWEADSYVGQVMNHHADRIYGIDISRYEHDKSSPVRVQKRLVDAEGRDSIVTISTRTVDIDWSDLRITHLGGKAPKVTGDVDYPVDFIFIKSTEGMDWRNRYYNADLDSILAHNIPVAAYHFYSHKSRVEDQVVNFLEYSRLNEGTIRPVLDIEPSAAQLRAIGGIDQLLSNMVYFVDEVQKASGLQCVLYLNQTFVNNYWERFPERLKQCDIWLAKYHENHPFTKYDFWQFTDRGHVKGIVGNVDINVFYGSRKDFDHWRSLK